MLHNFISVCIEAVVGFTQSTYIVFEADGIANIEIGVLSGSIQRDIPLVVTLSERFRALGEQIVTYMPFLIVIKLTKYSSCES